MMLEDDGEAQDDITVSGARLTDNDWSSESDRVALDTDLRRERHPAGPSAVRSMASESESSDAGTLGDVSDFVIPEMLTDQERLSMQEPLREGLLPFEQLLADGSMRPGQICDGVFVGYSIENGVLTGFHDRGGRQIAALGVVEAGYLSGPWTYYHPNGATYWTANFNIGVATGEMTVWSSDGQVTARHMFDRFGRRHGTCTYFDRQGRLTAESGMYDKGIKVD
ncbi:MAG: hypothetical protein AAGJ92_03665 [Pseudomonadota bacterium]